MAVSAQAQRVEQVDFADRVRDCFERSALDQEALVAARPKLAKDFKSLLQILAREIDEIVLPRQLCLRTQGRDVAHLTASNRKLIEAWIDGSKLEVGRDGQVSRDDVARAYAQALHKLLLQHGSLTLCRLGSAPMATASYGSCSGPSLERFAEAAHFDNRMHMFLEHLHKNGRGWIFVPATGDTLGHDPDRSLIDKLTALKAFVQKQTAVADAKETAPVRDVACSFFPLAKGVEAIVATDGQDQVYAAVTQEQIIPALRCWQRIFG